MQGRFSVGLIEVVGYLIPGVVVVGAAALLAARWLGLQPHLGITASVLFLLAAYVVGHLLTVLSVSLVWLRGAKKAKEIAPVREERLGFYAELRVRLEDRLGTRLAREEEYPFCFLIAREGHPLTAQHLDRLQAMTLFTRNTSFAFLIVALAIAVRSPVVGLICLVVALLFFLRYRESEGQMADMVFRAAYLTLTASPLGDVTHPGGGDPV